MEAPTIRDHLERLMPVDGRARRLVGWGVVAWTGIGAAILLGVVVLVLERVSPVVPYLVMAAMVVFVLNPVVNLLVRRGISRRLAATVVFVAAVALTALLLALMVPALIHQAQTLGRTSPGLVRKGGGLFDRLARSSNPFLRQAGQAISGWLVAHAGSAPKALQTLGGAGLRLAHAGAVLVVGGFLGFLFLLSLSDRGSGLWRLVPPSSRGVVDPTIQEVRRIVAGYVRARLIVSAAVGVLATLGLFLIHMPFWLLLGIVVGVANLIPMLGSFIGGIPVALVALVTKPPSFLLAALAVITVAHMVDGYILSPIVLKETTNLHPVVILLAVLVGAELFGFWGILAAIPVAGVLAYALRMWVVPRIAGPPEAPSVAKDGG